MSITPLTPRQAALIARGVYQLRESAIADVLADGNDLGTGGEFALEAGKRFEGRSGALAFKKLTGFGYVAAGTGRRQGELLIATRGTAIGIDWLSNFNVGVQRGPSSHLVHAGFHEVWKTFRDDLRDFVRGRNVSHVHCVGHSLGGALAGLNADWASSQRLAATSLYTFGAPRLGLPDFSRELTERLGADNIYRVSHVADPVPMIPIFPFRHMPYTRGGYVIRNGGGLISIAAHNMLGSYIPGVGTAGWDALANEDDEPTNDDKIKRWVESTSNSGGPAHLSASLLGLIARALNWLLKQAKNLVVGAIGTVVAIGATVLDQIAYLLARAADLSGEIAGWVRSLVGRIFSYLGRAMVGAAQITAAFLRWTLGLLWSSLQATATRALTYAGVG